MNHEVGVAEEDHALPHLVHVGAFSGMSALVAGGMQPEETAWHEHLAPFGIPVLIMADNPQLLTTATAAYAHWKEEAGVAEPAIMIRLGSGTTSSSDVSCEIRVEGSRLTIEGAGIAGYADATSGRAECIVPLHLISDTGALAAEVVDPLLLFLLSRSGRVPVHAAGVIVGETTLLLAGPSGSGKSTLAFAASARGLQVLSDDTVFVQLRPSLRIWGLPRPIHLFPQDAPSEYKVSRLRAGKLKVAVPLPAASVTFSANGAKLILLQRGNVPHLEPIEAHTAMAAMARLEPGFDLLVDESTAAARTLTANGAWRLTLSHDPMAAIDLLRARFGSDGLAP